MISSLGTPKQVANWLKEKVTGELCSDSRRIERGDGFVAWPGYAVDGRAFVQNALNQGASACLVEQDRVDEFADGWDKSLVIAYKGLKADCGLIADEYFDTPTRKIKVLAVTGTNGKTSITWWIGAILGAMHKKCGVIGTLGVGEVNGLEGNTQKHNIDPLATFKPNGLTTPDPITLQRSLKEFTDRDFEYCALEASSIGLAEHRLSGTRIETAIFTNLSRDHLDYHSNMQEYWEVKKGLFQWPDLKGAVINVDDPKGLELYKELSAKKNSAIKVIAYGHSEVSNLRATEVIYPNTHGGLSFKVTFINDAGLIQSGFLETKFVGMYNVSNLLAVIGTLCNLGFDLQTILHQCEYLSPVVGRMQRIEIANKKVPIVIVDYAHTPDALEKALQSLVPIKLKTNGKLHCLVGCGGERDAGKRSVMAEFANKYSDSVIFTSDNPRGESAQAIINDMLKGIESADQSKVDVELDRGLAISKIICRAKGEDVVLIAGKGHENYQDINGVKIPFSDALHAKESLMSEYVEGGVEL